MCRRLARRWRINAFFVTLLDELRFREGLEFVMLGVACFGGFGRRDAEQFAFVAVDADDGGDELVQLGAGDLAELGVVVGVVGSGDEEASEGETQHGQVDLLMLADGLDVVRAVAGIAEAIG